MKKTALYMIWLLLAMGVAVVQSCSSDAEDNGKASGTMHRRVLTMDLSLGGFTETSSRATSSFSNGDKVYIDFGGAMGTAEYNGGQWIIECPDDLQETDNSTCSVVYIQNASSEGSQTVSLSTESIVYEATGEYTNTVDMMSVSAALSPATSRVHFRGTAGTEITVKGLKRSEQFDVSSFTFSESTDDVQLTVKSDGYTDYVYCLFASDGNELAIVNDGSTFTRSFGSNVLQAGHSGYITIPTANSYSGWETDSRTDVSIDGSDYDGDSDWNQEDQEPDINVDTPVNGYDDDENWNATVHNGHEYVDLGLSVKWATMNVGALKPEGYGHYFAWGEIYSKTEYSWAKYKWCNDISSKMTKYSTSTDYWDSSLGTSPDRKNTIDPEDDVAHVKWGGSWRMPTQKEQEELVSECTWTLTSQNGVKGRKVTGPNGNFIFLPAAGYSYDNSLNYAGSYGRYWSSSLNESSSNLACGLFFDSSNVDCTNYGRFFGLPVRPVCP